MSRFLEEGNQGTSIFVYIPINSILQLHSEDVQMRSEKAMALCCVPIGSLSEQVPEIIGGKKVNSFSAEEISDS